jgi:pimeloyl-ACP methyl ester carboxylesterase
MTTIVLLPGMDGTGELFEPFITALGPAFKINVVRYPTSRTLNYEELEAIAREAIPLEGPFIILGESFSGPIAVSLAAAGSPRLKGLVLCCTFVRNPIPPLAFLQPIVRALPIKLAPIRALSHLVLGRFSSERLRNALVQAISQVSSQVFRARLQAVLTVDVSQKLTRVSVPVLYLRALQDRLVPQSASKLVSQLCPNVKVAPVEGPHFLLQASSEQAANVVSTFVHSVENAL